MARKRKSKERSYGWTGPMSEEQLAEHRELQALRAAGVLNSSRRIHGGRTRRNPKKVGHTPGQLKDWVDSRFDKLDETVRAHPDTYEYGLLGPGRST